VAENPEPGARLAVGDDLAVVIVRYADLREQDINAQVMQPREFDRLTENIRIRGQLESLPYCHQAADGEPMYIVSGHHRVRAAVAAGVEYGPVLLDTAPMTLSQVRSKQIAHNQLHGEPDRDVLAQLVRMIDNVDDLLATGLPDDFLPTVEKDDTALSIPHAEFDWRTVTLAFLPRQLADFTACLDVIDKHSDVIGAADRELYERFAEAAYRYGQLQQIRSMATAIGLLISIAAREVSQAEQDGVKPGSDWVRTAHLVGGAVPPDAAKVIAAAVEKMTGAGDAAAGQPWQALERLAADYLAGP
jgi:hypothetical protein